MATLLSGAREAPVPVMKASSPGREPVRQRGWGQNHTMMTDREAYIALSLLPKIGPVRVRKLLEVFGSPQAILGASRDRIRALPGFGNEIASQISGWENAVDLATELSLIDEAGITILTQQSTDYPELLLQIYDPPLILYVWGEIRSSDRRALGVVGSRRATHYGLQATKKLSFQVAQAGVAIISGMARGIDTAAHEGALAAGGRTIAVIGSGLGKLYPPENQALAERIALSGAVISEFPIRYPPDRQSFPLRNRIISGMAEGILVVEAPARSGALITADQASEQGRNVYAVPGPIDRATSVGTNRLIQQGAKLVLTAEDILEDFGVPHTVSVHGEINEGTGDRSSSTPAPDLTDEEASVYGLLSSQEIGIEAIIEQTGLPAANVSTTLMRLEMRRLVKQLPGKNFVKLI